MFYMWTQCCCDSKKKKKQPQATPNCFMVKLQAPLPPVFFESLISDVLVIFLKAEPRFINF